MSAALYHGVTAKALEATIEAWRLENDEARAVQAVSPSEEVDVEDWMRPRRRRWLGVARLVLFFAMFAPGAAVAIEHRLTPAPRPAVDQRYLIQQYLDSAAMNELNEKETEQFPCPGEGCPEHHGPMRR